jgi:hypothetical protein
MYLIRKITSVASVYFFVLKQKSNKKIQGYSKKALRKFACMPKMKLALTQVYSQTKCDLPAKNISRHL